MMSWINFLMWVLAIYFFYYGGNIAFDLLRPSGQLPQTESREQAVYLAGLDSEDELNQPLMVADEDEIDYFVDDENTPVPQSPIYASAGVSLKEMFALAKSESIEFTGKVKY